MAGYNKIRKQIAPEERNIRLSYFFAFNSPEQIEPVLITRIVEEEKSPGNRIAMLCAYNWLLDVIMDINQGYLNWRKYLPR